MNGYIIETTCPTPATGTGEQAVQWIGIMASARAMIAALPGHSPSVVDRGAGVMARARTLGLLDGEFRKFVE